MRRLSEQNSEGHAVESIISSFALDLYLFNLPSKFLPMMPISRGDVRGVGLFKAGPTGEAI